MNRKEEGPASPLERLQRFFESFSGGGAKPPDPKRKQMHFSIVYFLLALFLMTVVHDWYLAAQVETLSYSEFKDLVREDKLENLVVETDRIRGAHKDGQGPKRPSARSSPSG